MRAVILLVLVLIAGSACAPYPHRLDLGAPCPQELVAAEVVTNHWLNQHERWRLRQSALLELRGRRLALEGFMVLDLRAQQLHLVAMNEMGVVLFELIVTPDTQELRRALPPLQQQHGLAEGIAAGLRRVYLQPRPQLDDLAQMRADSLRLWRLQEAGDLNFIFTCDGLLRAVRQSGDDESWQVLYLDYQRRGERAVPEKIVMNDFQHAVTLTLWQREITLDP